MKKAENIGIISLYYHSDNYGANLQSFALCKALQKLGYNVEQIRFSALENTSIFQRTKQYLKTGFVFFVNSGITFINNAMSKYFFKYFCNDAISLRIKTIQKFNEDAIPHSKAVYNHSNITNTLEEYDLFITGSDQVWNFDWYNAAYFLDFVPSDTKKLSYAASLGTTSLNKRQKEIITDSLLDYAAISVREKHSIELLSPLVNQKIEWVLDPTLLLSKIEWDSICSKRLIEKPYIFCYFLGDEKKERKAALEFSKKHNLCIVTVPYLLNRIMITDLNFGDIRLYDVSPEDLISLIKNSSYVFTDSFHATVFSILYEKEVFVFPRKGYAGMSERINTLTSLFNCTDHFISKSKQTYYDCIEKLKPINYSEPFVEFEKMQEKSIQFLINNLK